MKKTIHVYSTFHYGFVVFTTMENQGNAGWDYEENHSYLFNIPSWFCCIYHNGNQGNAGWDYEENHSRLFNIPSWFCCIYHNGKSR